MKASREPSDNDRSLGESSPRAVFDQLALRGQECVHSVGEAAAALMDSGTWAALQPKVRQSVGKHVLALAMQEHDVEIGDLWGGKTPLEQYLSFLDTALTLKVRLTDSSDAVVVKHLAEQERAGLAASPEALGTHMRRHRPLWILWAGQGLVYWDPDIGSLQFDLKKTVITVSLPALRAYVGLHRDCLIEMPRLVPTSHGLTVDQRGSLLARTAMFGGSSRESSKAQRTSATGRAETHRPSSPSP